MYYLYILFVLIKLPFKVSAAIELRLHFRLRTLSFFVAYIGLKINSLLWKKIDWRIVLSL